MIFKNVNQSLSLFAQNPPMTFCCLGYKIESLFTWSTRSLLTCPSSHHPHVMFHLTSVRMTSNPRLPGTYLVLARKTGMVSHSTPFFLFLGCAHIFRSSGPFQLPFLLEGSYNVISLSTWLMPIHPLDLSLNVIFSENSNWSHKYKLDPVK